MTLARGLWYEEGRDRYRVRIYRNRTIVHLSYHKELKDAEAVLRVFEETTNPTVDRIDKMINQTRLYFRRGRRGKQ